MMVHLLVLASLALVQDDGPKIEDVQSDIRRMFAEEYRKRSPEDIGALATKLFTLARDGKNDPVTTLALYMEARDLYLRAYDGPGAVGAIDAISKIFGVANLEGKIEALKKTGRRARGAEANAALAAAWVDVGEEAIAAGEYAVAYDAARDAQTAARKAKDQSVYDRTKDLMDRARELKKEYTRAAPALKTLESNPADPDANLTAGRFTCFVRDDWAKGLPMLAKGAEPKLAELAGLEVTGPADATARGVLADRWWDWAERQTGAARDGGLRRAVHWYEETVSDLTAASQARAEARLTKYYTSGHAGAGGAVQRGNVALATNGTVVTGALRPELLIDGVVTGHTGSSGFSHGSYPTTWKVTFKQPYLLREIRFLIWDGEDRFYRYALETSPDGETFVPLVDRSKKGKWRSWQTHRFAPRRVKVIKVIGTYNSANGGFHAVELEAYCIPPAVPAKPTRPSEPE